MLLASKVRVSVALPEELLQSYEKKAQKDGITIEEFLVRQLTRCETHQAMRPLYFGDKEREELEMVLGGALCQTPADVLKELRSRFTLTFGGEAIRIDAPLYQALKIKAQECGLNLREVIVEQAKAGIRRWVWGE